MCIKCDKVPETKPEENKVEPPIQPQKCGYCGSTNPSIDPEEMYGPGATGWPCCPDCGGV